MMDRAKRVPLSGQENISQGKSRKSSQKTNKFAVNKASAVTDVRKSRVQVKNKGVQTEIGSLDHEMCTSVALRERDPKKENCRVREKTGEQGLLCHDVSDCLQ
ncbi:hypothetical protein GBAR_LOCUS14261 [Geodia barretti]|uniref:Uncharacterized protein n=1 Tax=Geodia barretti TaxID=519541 RepID=A0AA35S968_GEOBA|nr:hypothetical protein GBAR_LOCUS14261 [Geodia barretti]